MQVLMLDRNLHRVDRCMIGFIQAGIGIIGSASVAVADSCLKSMPVDLLVITADAAGSGTRGLINAAETRNPDVATILLAADVARASDIAAQSLPSVHCVLSADCPPEQVLRLAMASLQPAEDVAPMPAPQPAAPPAAVFDAPPPAAETAPATQAERAVFSSTRRRAGLAPTAAAA